MKYPKKLTKNIAFIAPSFGCTFEPYKSRMENSIKKLNDSYKVNVYENCYKSELPYRSNTAQSCAGEFMNAYKEDNEVLMSVGGGEYMVEILDHINFDELKELDPKWFIGYSDNTNLTYLLPILCDVATIYGPNAPDFGLEANHQSISDSLDLLTNNNDTLNSYEYYESNSKLRENELSNLVLDTKSSYYINKQTKVEGRLIGGCLDIIISLIGTKYDKVNDFLEKYKNDGFIWFLEACDLNPMDVKRAIKQMENAGYFKYVKGFMIGRPIIKDEMFGINHLNAYLDILNKYNVLILGDADLGHVKPSMPIVCGAIGELETKENKYSLKIKLR
ncbi:MAG: LD-carboxypeptidase [bacterium]